MTSPKTPCLQKAAIFSSLVCMPKAQDSLSGVPVLWVSEDQNHSGSFLRTIGLRFLAPCCLSAEYQHQLLSLLTFLHMCPSLFFRAPVVKFFSYPMSLWPCRLMWLQLSHLGYRPESSCLQMGSMFCCCGLLFHFCIFFFVLRIFICFDFHFCLFLFLREGENIKLGRSGRGDDLDELEEGQEHDQHVLCKSKLKMKFLFRVF